MINKVRKCTKCGEVFKIYLHYYGNQDLCPKCRSLVEKEKNK